MILPSERTVPLLESLATTAPSGASRTGSIALISFVTRTSSATFCSRSRGSFTQAGPAVRPVEEAARALDDGHPAHRPQLGLRRPAAGSGEREVLQDHPDWPAPLHCVLAQPRPLAHHRQVVAAAGFDDGVRVEAH